MSVDFTTDRCPNCGLPIRIAGPKYAGRLVQCEDCGTHSQTDATGRLTAIETTDEPKSHGRVAAMTAGLVGLLAVVIGTGPQPPQIVATEAPPAARFVDLPPPRPDRSDEPIEVVLAAELAPPAGSTSDVDPFPTAERDRPAVELAVVLPPPTPTPPILIELARDEVPLTRRRLDQSLLAVSQPQPVPVLDLVRDVEELIGHRIHFEPFEPTLAGRTVQLNLRDTTVDALLQAAIAEAQLSYRIRWDGSLVLQKRRTPT